MPCRVALQRPAGTGADDVPPDVLRMVPGDPRLGRQQVLVGLVERGDELGQRAVSVGVHLLPGTHVGDRRRGAFVHPLPRPYPRQKFDRGPPPGVGAGHRLAQSRAFPLVPERPVQRPLLVARGFEQAQYPRPQRSLLHLRLLRSVRPLSETLMFHQRNAADRICPMDDGLLSRLTRDYRDAMWSVLADSGTGADRLRTALHALCDVADRHLHLLTVNDAVFHQAADRVRDITGQAFSFLDPFTAALRAGAADKTLQLPDTPAPDLADAVFNTVCWGYVHLRNRHGWPDDRARGPVLGLHLADFVAPA